MICKIKINYKKEGTGFFCKIKNPNKNNENIIVLLACYHTLDIKDIEDQEIKNIVCIIEEKKKTLNLENRGIWSNKDLDYTCIEILEEVNIKEYFEIDDKIIINKIKKFIYLDRETIKFDVNYLKSIKKHLLLYNCNTEPGWSGGPIFNQENNKVLDLNIGMMKMK